MKVILISSGHLVLVDDVDFERVSKYSWYLNNGYARSSLAFNTKIYMHRFIMGVYTKKVVDHVNGNTLDNRRANLRVCSQQQNASNRGRGNGKSKYKGVCLRSDKKKWTAAITVNYETIYLGSFETQEQAALAYNSAALEHFGEFAQLNIL